MQQQMENRLQKNSFYTNTKKSIHLFLGFFFLVQTGIIAQNINIEGTILDENKNTIPYAAIGIVEKSIGTSSNDDGVFFLKLTSLNLSDTLTVSSIGFKSYKIAVKDYINKKEKTIILVEDVVSLDEITITNVKPNFYVKKALRNIRKTSLDSYHQLSILYRRFSTENYTPRFLVEQYINVLDKGLTLPSFEEIQVVENRKSADYRFVKKKQNFHAVAMIAKQNPLRKDFYANDYKWEIKDYSSYDGEEIAILEGIMKGKPANWVRLFIGVETYGIYKLEKSHLNAVYIYKKNQDGKLYLSYHNREYKSKEPISLYYRNLMKLKSKTMDVSYRHEAIVLGIETNWKNIDIRSNALKNRTDMGDYTIPYRKDFWKNLSMPPDSKFYLDNKKGLEAIFGVPLEKQYQAAN